MNISVERDGIEIGEWTEAEVRDFYREGRLVDTDHFWREGMTEWTPLSRLIRPAPPFPATSPKVSVPNFHEEVLPVAPRPIAPIPTPSPRAVLQEAPSAIPTPRIAQEIPLAIPIPRIAFVPPDPLVLQSEVAGFKTRFAARTIDTALIAVPAFIFSIPVFILFGFAQPGEMWSSSLPISPLWIFSVLGQIIAFDSAFLLWDVVWIGTIGTTPGKLMFGLSVVRRDGEEMQMGIAWKRVWRLFNALWFLLGFPFLTFGRSIYTEREFNKTGSTTWDQIAGTIVTGQKIGVMRKTFGTILFILSVFFWLYIAGSNRQSN